MTSARDGVAVVSITAFAALVLGPWGAVAAALAATAVIVGMGLARARDVFLLAAMALLASAGVSALAESPVISRWKVTFAADRPVAGALGATAAAALFAHLVIAVGDDRAPAGARLPRWVRHPIPRELARDALAVLATVGGGLLLRASVGPIELPPGVETVRANLAAGIGYASGLPDGVSVAPLTPGLLLVTGLSATALATVALGAIALEGAELARRAGRPPVLGAAIAMALPSAWGATLPVLVAAALLGGAAVVLLAPWTTGNRRRAAVAGCVAAAALFADPSALAGAGCLGAWLVIEGHRSAARLGRFLAPVAVGVGALALGFRRVDVGLDWWGAGGDLPDHPMWLVAIDLLLGLLVVVPVAVRRRDLATVVALGLLLAAVGLAQAGRSGSMGWVWGAVLVASLAFAGDRRGALRTRSEGHTRGRPR